MTRRGWTLHEMLISMCVMSGVVALASHMATEQLRFFRGVGDVIALKGQVGQATLIAVNVVWGASPPAGDIVAAQDSAFEAHVPFGAAVVCGSAPGRISMTAPARPSGNTLAAFVEPPEPGDRVAALFADSAGATWLNFHVASAPSPDGGCGVFGGVAWTLSLQEPMTLPVGAALRFTRPLRLSLYRASDSRWYLGAKDWNGASQRFNTIQPVAGPLRPYSANRAATGLLFVYRDAAGFELTNPVDGTRIASVTVVARAIAAQPVRVRGLAPGPGYMDSAAVGIGLRNAR